MYWLCFGIFHFCTTIIIIIEDITPYYKHLYRVSWCYYCIIEFTCNCEFSMKCINYIIIIHGHRLTSCALYHACIVMLDPIENPVLLLVYQYHCHWCALVGHPSTSNCAHSPLKLWLLLFKMSVVCLYFPCEHKAIQVATTSYVQATLWKASMCLQETLTTSSACLSVLLQAI